MICAQLDTSKAWGAPTHRWIPTFPRAKVAQSIALQANVCLKARSKHTPCILQGKSTMDGSTLWKKEPWRPPKPASDFGLLPYVFFYLGLCLKIKRVSWIESDPLLLPPGSVLLLLQQHPGEFLCSDKETQKCFLLETTLTSQVLAANSSFYASMHSGVDAAAQAKKASSEGRRDGPQRIGGKLGNPLRWKATGQSSFSSCLLPKLSTIKLNFFARTFSYGRKMEKTWRQQYLKQRAAIKTGIHSSIAARIAYAILQKNQLQEQQINETQSRNLDYRTCTIQTRSLSAHVFWKSFKQG